MSGLRTQEDAIALLDQGASGGPCQQTTFYHHHHHHNASSPPPPLPLSISWAAGRLEQHPATVSNDVLGIHILSIEYDELPVRVRNLLPVTKNAVVRALHALASELLCVWGPPCTLR